MSEGVGVSVRVGVGEGVGVSEGVCVMEARRAPQMSATWMRDTQLVVVGGNEREGEEEG